MRPWIFFCMLYFNRTVVFFFPLCGIRTNRLVAQDVCCSHFSISFGLQKIPLKTRFAERRVGLSVAWLVNGLQQLAHGHEPPPLETGVLNYWINSSLSKDRGDRATALRLGRQITLLYKKLGVLGNVKICLQNVWPKISTKLNLWYLHFVWLPCVLP